MHIFCVFVIVPIFWDVAIIVTFWFGLAKELARPRVAHSRGVLQLGWHIQLLEIRPPTCTQHVSGLPTHALNAGHAWAQPGPAFGGGARGPYLRAARAAAAVRASRPARATCSKRVRAVPARPLGSGTCAAPLPGAGCSGCAWGCTENSPVSRPRPAYRFLRKPSEAIR